jgi:hypothetical protein
MYHESVNIGTLIIKRGSRDAPGTRRTSKGDLLLFEQRVNPIANSVDLVFSYVDVLISGASSMGRRLLTREFSSGIKINRINVWAYPCAHLQIA